jgi:ribosome-binding ATPase
MGFKCGIVGLPNVGKSTLFNALTQSRAEASNYPFCTIQPNTGIVRVPDPRLMEISHRIKPKAIIPTQMQFVDIAGLVKGASQGEGLGNQFLGHIRETQAILHVVRVFEDPNVVHVSGQTNPVGDVEVIETELMLADLETVTKKFSALQRQIKGGQDKKAARLFGLLGPIKEALEAGQPVRSVAIEEPELLQELHLITLKPMMYVANMDEVGMLQAEKLPLLRSLLDHAAKTKTPVVLICGKTEAELAELEADEQLDFLKELGVSEPGLHKVIRAGYGLLGLQTFFTAGEVEVRAWTVRMGARAPQAAGVIHTDFERGFIKAEIYHYDDLIHHGTEAKIRDAGALRLEGKDYVIQDGDVCHFRFAV